jgi:nucleosome binding factor SPN SPT16 subunit
VGQDPDKFIEDGGWEFLNMEASDSDSEKSEESDEGYEPSDVEVVSESEDDDSDDESVVESDDDEVCGCSRGHGWDGGLDVVDGELG